MFWKFQINPNLVFKVNQPLLNCTSRPPRKVEKCVNGEFCLM